MGTWFVLDFFLSNTGIIESRGVMLLSVRGLRRE